jgi:hypothetical protein
MNATDDLIKNMKDKSDPRADPYYEFLRKEGILGKISHHDARKIFNYFKENWRPE